DRIHYRSPEELLGLSAENLSDDREFPDGAAEPPDEASRRDFIKLMSASAALAGVGLTGCRRPEEHIYAFGKQPEGYVHGVPQYFASAMPTRNGAVPVVVKSNDGRPTKIEGNPEHPDSNGSTSLFAQSSILDLYDADRARRFARHGKTVSAGSVWDALTAVEESASYDEGASLAFLSVGNTSPSMERLWAKVQKKFKKAVRAEYEPVDSDIHRRAATMATGQPVKPRYDLSKAKRILSLDCDFLGADEDVQRYTRDFAKGRKTKSAKDADSMNRLYTVEALMTQTGANADHRLRIKPSQMVQLAARLALDIAGDSLTAAAKLELKRLAADIGDHRAWIKTCAEDLVGKEHSGASVVLVGERQPLAVHLLAHIVNQALKSKAVSFLPDRKQSNASISDLAKAIESQQVQNLIILGDNPAYNAPADLNWAKLQSTKGLTSFRLGFSEDETFKATSYHIPEAHYLESWGDARTSDGTYVPVQPLIAPLHGGVTALEVLARFLGESKTKPHDIVQETFGAVKGARISWKQFLHDGFRADSQPNAVRVTSLKLAVIEKELQAIKSLEGTDFGAEVVFSRDYSVDDGRYSNNGWLQELPDPITKLTWDNAITVSRKTAVDELNVKNGDIVTLSLGTRSVEGPVWVQPGQADGVLGVMLGYGRKRGGRIANFDGKPVGYNGYAIRRVANQNSDTNAIVKKAGGSHAFSGTQEHWAMHGRPIVREANLEQFKKNPEFAQKMGLEGHTNHLVMQDGPNGQAQPTPIYKRPYEDPSKKDLKSDVHQWGMVIDLNSCVGCSACVIACQSENNIPIVGKDQVSKGREMHWLRIDRYFTGDPEKTMKYDEKMPLGPAAPVGYDADEWKQDWIDDPQVVNQPMMCQHCENAPCESVCPVNATAHDTEGINVMAYNRCVGTRYCSNNCAWKVRRFNWFDYSKRPTNKLYTDNITDFLGMRLNKRPDDEIDLLAMAKNPDVTVRMRGVMEKCTFCVQRIEQAKINQKVKAQDSNDVEVKEGGVQTACQQSCPAEAIVFGNLLDENSEVSKLKKDPRNYEVLGFLDNNARLTYLAKVRNPNPAMPGYHDSPYGLAEYKEKFHDDPIKKGHH
ncbi:MAG: Fe-S-cluster-containing hydrogenase, partial [Limisphaerales bacterium]